MKNYTYFISYSSGSGFGNAILDKIKSPIKSIEDIQQLERALEETKGFDKVVIISFNLI